MQSAKLINGIHTEVCIQSYGDRILVLLTQLGKVGCLIQVSIPPTSHLPPTPPPTALPSIPSSIALTALLGQPPPDLHAVYHLYASQIATILWTHEGENALRRPVVVGVALKRNGPADIEEDGGALSQADRDLFAEVMTMVKELLVI